MIPRVLAPSQRPPRRVWNARPRTRIAQPGRHHAGRLVAEKMTSLSDLVTKAASEIDAAQDLAALDAVRVSYLGKKGEITARLKTLGQLPPDERSAAGAH